MNLKKLLSIIKYKLTQKVVYVADDFLSDDQCDFLINLHNNGRKHYWKHVNAFISKPCFVPGVQDKIQELCNSFETGCIESGPQLVEWTPGSSMKPHYDLDFNDKFACVIYLNDNFGGGETCFSFGNHVKEVKPKKGRIVFFSNSNILHWVNEVSTHNRYTLAIYYVPG